MPNWIETNLILGDPGNLTRPFECRFQARAAQHLSFQDACDYTANKIRETYHNLYLALSGGLDSVCVANVLLRNKIDFTPIIVDDRTSGADLDVWYAYEWCQTNQITPVVYDLDDHNREEVNKKILSYAVANHTFTNSIYLSCWIAELIPDDACLITGDGEIFHVPSHFTDTCPDYLELYEGCYYLPLTLGNRHPGGFFHFTPELVWSMVRWADLSKNTQQIKASLYQLPFRPKCFAARHTQHKHLYPHIMQKYNKPKNLQLYRISRQDLLNQIG